MIKYPHAESFKNLERQVKLETDFVGRDKVVYSDNIKGDKVGRRRGF
jgi:hypothetical protein